MIRKLASGEYRLYSRKKDPKTGRRRNLGTFRHARRGRKARAGGSIFQTPQLVNRKYVRGYSQLIRLPFTYLDSRPCTFFDRL